MSLRLRRWLNDHSHVYRHARRALGREERQPSGSLTLVPPPHEFRVLHRPFDADIAQAWRVTEALLVRFAHEVRAAGARPIILHVPLRESVHRELWTAIAARQGFSDAWRPDADEEELRRVCDAHRLECVFPSAAMREAAGRGVQLYFRDDPHWTRLGHRLVGRVLAEALPGQERPSAPLPAPMAR